MKKNGKESKQSRRLREKEEKWKKSKRKFEYLKKTVAVIHSTTIGKNKKNKENIDIILLIKPPAEHGKIGNISREFGKD